jgi:hypothetical protein
VPWVVELSGDPKLVAGNTRVLDTLTDLFLIAIGESSVDVTVASVDSCRNSRANLTRL